MHNTYSFRTSARITAALIALLLTLFAGTTAVFASACYTNPSNGYVVVIEDGAKLLSDAEETQLQALMEQITEYGNAAFVTVADYENPYSSTQTFAEHYNSEHFGSSNATLFVIDMDERMIYVDTMGGIRRYLTSAYADTITDNVYRYASDGQYYMCAYQAFDQILRLLEGRRIAQPMKYVSNLLLAIITAMLINFFLVKAFSRRHRPSDTELLSGIYRQVNFGNIQVNFTNQTKTYSPPSSGGGGSGGGGGGHSGGGGGGHSGGGHRF